MNLFFGGVYAGNKKRGTYDNSCYTNTILLKKNQVFKLLSSSDPHFETPF